MTTRCEIKNTDGEQCLYGKGHFIKHHRYDSEVEATIVGEINPLAKPSTDASPDPLAGVPTDAEIEARAREMRPDRPQDQSQYRVAARWMRDEMLRRGAIILTPEQRKWLNVLVREGVDAASQSPRHAAWREEEAALREVLAMLTEAK